MTRAPLRALLLAIALLAAVPASAAAEFGIVPGSLTLDTVDAAGNPELRAGAHPDRMTTYMEFNSLDGTSDGNVKDLIVDLPAGLVGDSQAVPLCTREQFAVGGWGGARCPPQTQIGEALVSVHGFELTPAPIYNVEPAAGNLAEFGFRLFLLTSRIFGRIGADGQTLELHLGDLGQDLPVKAVKIDLWGVPADHQTDASGPRRAFLTLPTRCDGGPLAVGVRARSWQEQHRWRETSRLIPPPIGCQAMRFDPVVDLRLESSTADTPSGVRVDVTLPQNDDPAGQSNARAQSVEMLLPDGMGLSPGGAGGLEVCSEQAIGLGELSMATCPAASQLGTVEFVTPLLAEPLAGTLYMGRQLTSTEYRLFVVASGQGIAIKSQGTLILDRDSGRITTRLAGLPEMPFERISLSFGSGPRAPLVTPPSCGTGAASATLTPYGGGPAVTSASLVTIAGAPAGRPCSDPLPFAPGFVAGVSPARAARSGVFEMTLRRSDGDQLIDRFTMTMPPGVSANLASAGRCAAAAADSGSCPPSSRVGTLTAEVGSGASPLILGGDAFLTGPYHGSPFGLALRFPGKVGPFNLGTIVVRAKLGIDPRSGQVVVTSDRLPRVVDGVQLRLQTLALDIDRPGFIVNPTSCAATRAAAAVSSADGRLASRSTRFAVAGCRSLRFTPRVAVALTDRDELHKGGRPGLSLKIDSPWGGANLRVAGFELPALLGQSADGVTAICSLEQARDGRCPSGSRVGGASARTPLLAGRLKGSAYMVQPPDGGLPDVWVRVSGQGIALNLRMRTISSGDALRAKLVDLPDFPLSTFTVRFAGGEHGIFVAERSPCRRGQARRMVTRATLTGQNGAVRRSQPPVRAACGAATRKDSTAALVSTGDSQRTLWPLGTVTTLSSEPSSAR